MLDAAGRLEPRDPRDEMAAREPELRRERPAVLVERRLLGHRGPAERAADDDAPEGARLAADLPRDHLAIVVHPLKLAGRSASVTSFGDETSPSRPWPRGEEAAWLGRFFPACGFLVTLL
jgi:hypothetical protein